MARMTGLAHYYLKKNVRNFSEEVLKMMLLSIGTWWEALSTFVKIFYVLAITSSLVLLVQLIIALFGFGHDAGADVGTDVGGDADVGGGADFDGDADLAGHDAGGGHDASHAGAGLRLFTVQTIVSFLVTFGWSGVAFGSSGMPEWLGFILAFIIGTATLFGMAKLMQAMMKLQSSGNIDIENAVGLTGEVYIPVPASEGGMGKVNITIQGRYGEYNAITKGPELLKTGLFVKVAEVRGNTLIVEKAPDKAKE